MRIAIVVTLFVGVAFLSLAALPADAGLVLVVDSAADTSDANPGDGLCGTPPSPDPSPTPPGPGPFLAEVEPGTCTLRAAIQEANASAGHDFISFSGECIDFSSGDICEPGRFVRTLAPVSPLPAITDSVTIDGPEPPNAIVLSGVNAGTADGLILQARFNVIRRLVINGFSGAGILITGGAQSAIEGNFIGTDENGGGGAPERGGSSHQRLNV